MFGLRVWGSACGYKKRRNEFYFYKNVWLVIIESKISNKPTKMVGFSLFSFIPIPILIPITKPNSPSGMKPTKSWNFHTRHEWLVYNLISVSLLFLYRFFSSDLRYSLKTPKIFKISSTHSSRDIWLFYFMYLLYYLCILNFTFFD